MVSSDAIQFTEHRGNDLVEISHNAAVRHLKDGSQLIFVDGDDIAALMVHDGWAIADKRQTNKYVEEEKSAYLKKTGIWNGYFEEPAKWRAKRAAAEKKAKEADAQIKKQAEEKNSSNSSASSGISPIRGIKKLFGLDK